MFPGTLHFEQFVYVVYVLAIRQDKTMSVRSGVSSMPASIYHTCIPFYTIAYKLVDLQFPLVLS